MLEAFKISPYDYEAVCVSWSDAPIFTGRIKKDLAVNVWLAAMKEGCKKRKVPKNLWHRVAQYFLRGRAKTRFEDLKKVMRNMHNGRYAWNWSKFKIAMRNMGWELDSKVTQAWEIGSVPSGIWWIVGKGKNDMVGASLPPPTRQPFLLRSLKNNRGFSGNGNKAASVKSAVGKQKTSSQGYKSNLPFGEPSTKTTHVPIWLLNASHSLENLVSDYPRTMCALSAILVALGSVPSAPVVTSGAAGTFLASGAAQAIGNVVVGVGNWLGAQSAAVQELNK